MVQDELGFLSLHLQSAPDQTKGCNIRLLKKQLDKMTKIARTRQSTRCSHELFLALALETPPATGFYLKTTRAETTKGKRRREEAFQALARFPSLRPTGDLGDPVARPSDRSCRPHFCTASRRHAPRERTPGAAETVA